MAGLSAPSTGRSTRPLSRSRARDLRDDVLGRVEKRGVAGAAEALIEVLEIVADEEKRSSRGDRRRRPREHETAFVSRELEKEDKHEVEGLSLGHEVEEVSAAKVDLDLLHRGSRACSRDRHVGEVDRRDLPATLGEPHRAFPAGEVERPTCWEVGGLGCEGTVRRDGPELLRLGVLAIPVVTLHVAASFLVRRDTSRRA